MRVVVDDHIALVARLRALDLPSEVERPLLAVYAFELRLASALVVDRSSHGILQQIVDRFGTASEPVESLFDRSDDVRLLDTRDMALMVARVRAELPCNLLAGEVIAAARLEDASVRLAPANANGALVAALQRAGVPVAVWRFEPRGARLVVVEEPVFDS